MDVIVIGKKTFQQSDKPEMVYCGQSRTEAFEAVAATAGQFARYYFVDPLPHIPIRTPEVNTPKPEKTFTEAREENEELKAETPAEKAARKKAERAAAKAAAQAEGK